MINALLKLILGITLLLFVIVVGPLAGIWSLNTLFPVLHIELSWQTWLAFNCLFGGTIASRIKS